MNVANREDHLDASVFDGARGAPVVDVLVVFDGGDGKSSSSKRLHVIVKKLWQYLLLRKPFKTNE